MFPVLSIECHFVKGGCMTTELLEYFTKWLIKVLPQCLLAAAFGIDICDTVGGVTPCKLSPFTYAYRRRNRGLLLEKVTSKRSNLGRNRDESDKIFHLPAMESSWSNYGNQIILFHDHQDSEAIRNRN